MEIEQIFSNQPSTSPTFTERQIIGESLDLILIVYKQLISNLIVKLKSENKIESTANFHLGFEILNVF